MISGKTFIQTFLLAAAFFAQGCVPDKNKSTSKDYDLHNPSVLILNDALVEISGICFYPRDSSVFAISDESGYLFKIHLAKKIITQKWKFDKKRDFEDIFLKDSTFYVLESNGNIHTLNFSATGDTIYTRKNIFPQADKKKNEFESIYYDEARKSFVMICKDCKSDKKRSISSWDYDPETGKYTFSLFTVDAASIAKHIGRNKIKFQASAAAVNPITHDVWIVSAINHLLVVTDKNGVFKNAFPLSQALFTQPEGITFTPWGDLIISNEAGDKYNRATLFIFKLKKTI